MIGYQRKRRRKLALIALAIVATCVFAAPLAARLYVEYQYPFVYIGSSSYILGGIEFKNITIKQERQPKRSVQIDGTIDRVSISIFDKTVVCSGGKLDIVVLSDSDNRSATVSSGMDKYKNWTFYAEHLNVVATRGKVLAELQDVSYVKTITKNEAAFKTGHVQYHSFSVDIQSGRVPRSLDYFDAGKVSLRVPFPFKIPKLDTSKDKVELECVHVLVKERQAHVGSFKYNVFSGSELDVSVDDSKIAIAAKVITAQHKWLGKGPVTFHDIVIGILLKEKRATMLVGQSRLRLNVDLANQTLSGEGQCSDWVYALPEPRPEALQKVAKSYTGKLDVFITVKPRPDFKLHNTCSFRCSQSPIKDLFDPKGFTYTAYHPNGKPFERLSGPNQPDWIPIGSIPPQLAVAITTLEDPGFQGHHGILTMAIKNSLLANLKTGKFSRGGSTITMQLAKNLWLNREKTLLRKANEAMLTFALESCLTKEQILEFYLNVVEFGPDIYGIGPATKHYFSKDPSALTIEESFYLAMILPHPNRALGPQAGVAQAQGLMKILTKHGILVDDSESEIEE